MSNTLKYLWILLLSTLAIGIAILSTWGIPAPQVEVKKVYNLLQKAP